MTIKNLGEILMEQGVIDRRALERALQIQSRRLGEILIEERLADPVAIAQALKFQAQARVSRRANRLSIEATMLDEILRRLEGLEDQLVGKQAEPAITGFLSSLTSLRQSIEMLLLEPVDVLFQKSRMIASQLSGELGREADLVCEGGGLVVDRFLVDELSDMVLHLVRNSFDHGIEPVEVRTAAGKPPRGVVRLGVASFGGRLLVTVSDDGRGIDEDAVYAKAVEKGLLSAPREQVSTDEIHRLLFTPGFSTAEGTSTVSGRGVGLDVVEAAALRLGGDVHVRSVRGQGATFRISLPLRYCRMAILPLRVGDEWIAVNSSEITSIEQVSLCEGLLSASSLFGANAPVSRSGPFLKIECLAGPRWLFDEVGQPEDVLVREASAFAKGSHGVIGGTRMHSGRSLLVVDLGLLASIALPVQPISN